MSLNVPNSGPNSRFIFIRNAVCAVFLVCSNLTSESLFAKPISSVGALQEENALSKEANKIRDYILSLLNRYKTEPNEKLKKDKWYLLEIKAVRVYLAQGAKDNNSLQAINAIIEELEQQ